MVKLKGRELRILNWVLSLSFSLFGWTDRLCWVFRISFRSRALSRPIVKIVPRIVTSAFNTKEWRRNCDKVLQG